LPIGSNFGPNEPKTSNEGNGIVFFIGLVKNGRAEASIRLLVLIYLV
jgi:hypothetical protein